MSAYKDDPTLRIVIPTGFNLHTNKETGEKILGDGTKLTCTEAAEIAKDTAADVVLVTTCPVDGRMPWYEGLEMGRLMKEHIQSELWPIRIPVIYYPGDEFNTYGEVEGAIRYLFHEVMPRVRQNPRLQVQVTFVAKEWHSPRVRLLAWILAAHYGLSWSWFHIATHPLPIRKGMRAKTFWHEVLGCGQCLALHVWIIFKRPSEVQKITVV